MAEVKVTVKESAMTKAFERRMSILEKLLVQLSKKKDKPKVIQVKTASNGRALTSSTNKILEAIKNQKPPVINSTVIGGGQRVIPSPS